MKIIATVLAVALMGSGLARADGSPLIEKRSVHIECDETNCLVSIEDMAAIQRGNENLAAIASVLEKRVRELEGDLSKLREIKGCGKLEVLPKRHGAPAPGERPA